jgi:hypothetical protein
MDDENSKTLTSLMSHYCALAAGLFLVR